MFNIGEKTEIVGIENAKCKLSHIDACLHDKTKREPIKYDYFGKIVTRGTVVVHTKVGDLSIRFKEKNGWAERIEIEKA